METQSSYALKNKCGLLLNKTIKIRLQYKRVKETEKKNTLLNRRSYYFHLLFVYLI